MLLPVTPDEAVLALTELAAEAGIGVRVEPFRQELAGKGGLCQVEGKRVVLVDARLGAVEQAGVLGLALGRADLGGLVVPPDLVSYLRTGHGPVRPAVRAKPLARGRHLRLVAQGEDG